MILNRLSEASRVLEESGTTHGGGILGVGVELCRVVGRAHAAHSRGCCEGFVGIQSSSLDSAVALGVVRFQARLYTTSDLKDRTKRDADSRSFDVESVCKPCCPQPSSS